jgi:FMN-dependent NADH-azoreductase
MKSTLFINASPQGIASPGGKLAHELLAYLDYEYPESERTERDIAAQPLAPISAQYARALTKTVPFDSPEFELSEALIGELERADLLLINTPMHNFTLPAALKLWIDYVLRINRTFQSGPDGKLGLLTDRPVYVLVSSGGFHRGARARQPDFLTSYLRHAFATIGLFDLHFIYLQGLVFGSEVVSEALTAARQHLANEPHFRNLVLSEHS